MLEDGRVSEAGTHDELIEAGGLYAALWRVQTGEATILPDSSADDRAAPISLNHSALRTLFHAE